MSQFKPKDTPSLLTYLTVADAGQSIQFYQQAFGFTLIDASPAKEGKIDHGEMKLGEALVMFCSEGAYECTDKTPKHLGITMPLTIYVYVENVDSLYKQAIKNGAISKTEPNDAFWGDRYCALTDPDGYEWMFATHLNGA